MALEILREFVVFSKYLNISAAARELNMSQPTLSKHMADFEKEIDIKLIEHSHEMKLTSAGKIFLDNAGSILHHYDETLSKCRAVAHKKTSALLIQDPIAFLELQQCLARAIAAVPEIGISTEITLVPTQGYAAIDAIVRGIVDVGFMLMCPCIQSNKNYANRQIATVPLIKQRLRVSMDPRHPLAQKEALSFPDLRDVPLLVPANKVYDDWRNVLTDIFAKNGITPNFSMRVVQTINEFALITLQDEVLVTSSASSAQDPSGRFITKELVGECNEFILYAAYTADNDNPLVPLFVEQMGAGFVDEQSCELNCSVVESIAV